MGGTGDGSGAWVAGGTVGTEMVGDSCGGAVLSRTAVVGVGAVVVVDRVVVGATVVEVGAG
ncbi:hypothetical protein [Nocardia higoensis]|uniref:hypothetical protein n=1 Tax=Nocardia higoensis TaxID=228599 RepID=UPI000594C8D5|nr:hypothetical protein [Nocardia higoensis]